MNLTPNRYLLLRKDMDVNEHERLLGSYIRSWERPGDLP